MTTTRLKPTRRIVRCRGCNARIIWFATHNNRRMPVDADTVEPQDDTLDLNKHISHFSTCPNAGDFRRKR